MVTFTTEEKLALLLCVLGDDAERAAMKSIHPTRAVQVNKYLKEYKTEPPTEDEVAFIVDDFSKYFTFALETLKPELDQAEKNVRTTQRQQEAASSDSDGPQILEFAPIQSNGDYIDDLNRLDGFQIATALADDHPKTIAFVLNHLGTSLAASIIKQLNDDLRNQTVLYLSQDIGAPEAVANQILKTTFLKANSVREHKEEVNQADVLAKLMRSLPKDMRVELIEKLSQDNEEIVESIKSKLYVFEDILRLDDRDAQKLIAESGADHLVVGMQRVDPAIKAKLMDNLSKRARKSLEVEIEFKTNATDEEVAEARQHFVDALGRLDESGEISLN
jgi:flagellar motor switch protein FliG